MEAAIITWLELAMAGTAFSLFIGLVMNIRSWMDKVETNHLVHIQASSEKQVELLDRVEKAVLLHDAHEESHHESQTALLTAVLNKR
jgi:hypothetical protein